MAREGQFPALETRPVRMKPFLLASASTHALLAAPAVARASCPKMSLDNQAYTNATVICFLRTSGDVDLTNTNTGMIGTVMDTASTDTTTIDNAGAISGYGPIFLQGALTLTNRAGATISGSGGLAIYAGNGGITTIVNDGRIDSSSYALEVGGHLDLTNSGVIAGSASTPARQPRPIPARSRATSSPSGPLAT